MKMPLCTFPRGARKKKKKRNRPRRPTRRSQERVQRRRVGLVGRQRSGGLHLSEGPGRASTPEGPRNDASSAPAPSGRRGARDIPPGPSQARPATQPRRQVKARSLDWVCGENWKTYISHTVFFGAMSFGVVLFGAFSDIFGRIPVTVAVYMLAGAGAVATFFTESFYVFLGTRVIVGGVLLGIYTNPFVLVLEYMPPQKRMLMGGVFGLVYPLLGAALPWVAYAIGNWRLLNAVIVVPALIGTVVSIVNF
ncbi:hypothetical protein HPB52_005408 [Rhipicephalus sanguineus]|uniref:Major facilitator superfamily (MFS) profile domain-containing protein n=1 Tax=Rhipicephalus sanguineus TaxID=34632 RepID=A0A9D4QAE1_RHISA|nr:hypothetical protein HPB52_005408 [Rhipicephalus sanguineus]